MPDPLSHEEILRAQGVLTGLVEAVLSEVRYAPETAAITALACALISLSRTSGICFDAVLDQVQDADEYGQLPEGILDCGVTRSTVFH